MAKMTTARDVPRAVAGVLTCDTSAAARLLSLLVCLLEHRRKSAVARDHTMLEQPVSAALDELIVLAALLDELGRGGHGLRVDTCPDHVRRGCIAVDDDSGVGQQHAKRPLRRGLALRNLFVQRFDGLLALGHEA